MMQRKQKATCRQAGMQATEKGRFLIACNSFTLRI